MVRVSSLSILIVFLFVSWLEASVVYLNNGDKVTGTIVQDDEEGYILETEWLGRVSIPRDVITSIDGVELERAVGESIEPKKPDPHPWRSELSLGYNAARGNTETDALVLGAIANRKRKGIDEWNFKADFFLSRSNNDVTTQKWSGMGRYAVSFGTRDQWYRFYRIEADHDRFADISYRLIPTTGLGYWFFDRDDGKLMAEFGIGWQYTAFRNDTDEEGALSLIPRVYYERALFANTKFSQEVIFYPSVDELENYRLHAESAVTSALNEKLALRLKFRYDLNAGAPVGTQESDYRLLSSLVYVF